jgi:alcohol dehydrogenase class IV
MWFYSAPQIIFGEDALTYLEQVMGQRAFVVTDVNIRKLGLVEPVLANLAATGMAYEIFDQVEPEPSVATVRAGAERINSYAPDWIVAVGGGSVMDAAKAMWALYEWPHLEPEEISPIYPLQVEKARLIAIPTTSGTGSEATWIVVLTDTESNRKLALGHRQLMPTLAIVDPVMTAHLPPVITADTGMDVLTHAVEGFSANYNSPFSDPPCVQAAGMVFDALPRAVSQGAADMPAREMMANAATLAALGFSNAQVGLAHALGHSLGSLFKVPHGRAVGLFLPYIIQFSANAGVGRYDQLAQRLGLLPGDVAEGERMQAAADLLVQRIRGLMQQIGQPITLADLGISAGALEEQMETLCGYAMMDNAILAAPRAIEWDEMERIFLYAYEGRAVDF